MNECVVARARSNKFTRKELAASRLSEVVLCVELSEKNGALYYNKLNPSKTRERMSIVAANDADVVAKPCGSIFCALGRVDGTRCAARDEHVNALPLPTFLWSSGRTVDMALDKQPVANRAALRPFYAHFFAARDAPAECSLVAVDGPVGRAFWALRRSLWPDVEWDNALLQTPAHLPLHQGMMSLGRADLDACLEHIVAIKGNVD